jgi:hypothetical protein
MWSDSLQRQHIPLLQNGSEAHTASYSIGIRGKADGLEADHSPSSTAEVKNVFSLNLHSLVCLHGIHMDRDNFTFTYGTVLCTITLF